jgi:hypothetical protein
MCRWAFAIETVEGDKQPPDLLDGTLDRTEVRNASRAAEPNKRAASSNFGAAQIQRR